MRSPGTIAGVDANAALCPVTPTTGAQSRRSPSRRRSGRGSPSPPTISRSALQPDRMVAPRDHRYRRHGGQLPDVGDRPARRRGLARRHRGRRYAPRQGLRPGRGQRSPRRDRGPQVSHSPTSRATPSPARSTQAWASSRPAAKKATSSSRAALPSLTGVAGRHRVPRRHLAAIFVNDEYEEHAEPGHQRLRPRGWSCRPPRSPPAAAHPGCPDPGGHLPPQRSSAKRLAGQL